jgi:hypothetical protein
MAPLLIDPQNPMAGVADVEAVLQLLVAIGSISFSPKAEDGRLFLLEMVIDSIVAVARHLGHDPDPSGGAL